MVTIFNKRTTMNRTNPSWRDDFFRQYWHAMKSGRVRSAPAVSMRSSQTLISEAFATHAFAGRALTAAAIKV
jgi:hypothetical protein